LINQDWKYPNVVLEENNIEMKKIYFLLAIFLMISPLWIYAQPEGTIIYTESVSFDFEAPEGMEDMFKDMPKSRSSDKKLIFKEGKSLYKVEKSEDFEHEGTVDSEHATSVFKIKIHEPDNRTYSDLNEGKVVAQQELMGKTFLIKDDLKKFDWKVSSDRRKILDYECMKATATDDEHQITAWFTPQIGLGIGPGSYNGLPGAILMIETDEGIREIVAKEVSLSEVDVAEMVIPDKGKKVNREKFKAIEKEKMEEMESINGGPGVRMIIRN
jgi:GLPGLI family protein